MSHPNHPAHTVRTVSKDDIPQILEIERSAVARFGTIPDLAWLMNTEMSLTSSSPQTALV